MRRGKFSSHCLPQRALNPKFSRARPVERRAFQGKARTCVLASFANSLSEAKAEGKTRAPDKVPKSRSELFVSALRFSDFFS